MFIKIDQNLLRDPTQKKSWYRDAENGCDLFLWLDDFSNIAHFQLWHEDFLIEWQLEQGLKSGQLDPNDGSFHNLQSPSYHYHRTYLSEPLQKILQFLAPLHPAEIESKLDFVRDKLRQA